MHTRGHVAKHTHHTITLLLYFGIASCSNNDYLCINNKKNIRLVTLAEHTSDHGKQTNSNTEEWGVLLLQNLRIKRKLRRS